MPLIPRQRKPRKYPIKRDESGRSARSRAFELFDRGRRPTSVAPEVGVSARTACRYFEDWKKGLTQLDLKCRMLKAALHSKDMPVEEFAKRLAEALNMPCEQVLEEMERPWGLRRLVSGKVQNLQKALEAKTLARLAAALELVRLYEAQGLPPERIVQELDRLVREQRHGAAPNEGQLGR